MPSHRFNNSKILATDLNNITRAKQAWFRDSEQVAIDFFKDSFVKGGFTDTNFRRWRKRTRDYAWPTLIKTGDLHNSIKCTVRGPNFFVIDSELSYAKYQNDGTDRIPARQFIGKSEILTRKLLANLERIINRITR